MKIHFFKLFFIDHNTLKSKYNYILGKKHSNFGTNLGIVLVNAELLGGNTRILGANTVILVGKTFILGGNQRVIFGKYKHK